MNIRNITVLCGVAMIASVAMPSAKADQWDKKTTITVNEAIEIPSCCNPEHVIVLQPGTYVLALVSSLSDRHIVRVFAKDGITVITTTLAIPNYRLKPTGKTAFQYWETPAGQPRELRAWFYPGDNFGQEFAYHKQKSLAIAAFAKAPVPTVTIETEEQLKTAEVVVVDERGAERPVEVLVAANEPPPAPAQFTAAAAVAPARELPHTASNYPLFGLLGLGSLIAAALMSKSSSKRV
jgi:hypothetical protein